jgi:hypothetical protein
MDQADNNKQVSNEGISEGLGKTTAADGISQVVEAIANNIEQEFTGKVDGKQQQQQHEPSIAPGMNTSDALEEKATEEDIGKHDSTSVTRLYLDRTPED